ncbi:NAD(P)-binding protein [Coccomyxa subellipsoidea C-169]|uniref:NAD(P)-binding protein n=1 Tax=Coccomyxa subellipsoidea (strain C-169) TaxID=574566 RepID=I0YUL3_COCSC|nr:NAD(P)-binding protein [Coccomyxa subellipsoidea C-169]EIE22082.1 NAD(P)-binding protein [Coccomyxa subellipsoidea C-169]|eukprot:XP_005646626.1 NAD(P)-binding protein [Coccomyxa subellipsoidea C-169]
MASTTTLIIPDLKGKRVLVTGGSAGIGRATAIAFDANQCAVAVLGRRLERLDAVASQLKHGVSIVADLTKEEDMKRAIKETIEKLGGLDILVNCGGAASDEMWGGGEAAFIAALKLHVTGNLTLIRAAEEELVKNKGAIVNIASVVALIPQKGAMFAYGVAKAAQDKMTKDLAFEFAPKGVRVNSVLPATIDTEVFDTVSEKQGVPRADLLAAFAPGHAMNRVGQPEEVAAPIVFLASNAASFITGASLLIDGGATLGYWFNRNSFLE